MEKSHTALTVNGPRLWETIEASARIGPGRTLNDAGVHTRQEDGLPGVNVLLHAVLARADR